MWRGKIRYEDYGTCGRERAPGVSKDNAFSLASKSLHGRFAGAAPAFPARCAKSWYRVPLMHRGISKETPPNVFMRTPRCARAERRNAFHGDVIIVTAAAGAALRAAANSSWASNIVYCSLPTWLVAYYLMLHTNERWLQFTEWNFRVARIKYIYIYVSVRIYVWWLKSLSTQIHVLSLRLRGESRIILKRVISHATSKRALDHAKYANWRNSLNVRRN